MTTVLYAEQHW